MTAAANIRRVAEARSLYHDAVTFIVQRIQESIGARGTATLLLSGGSTPRAVYELLSTDSWQERVVWKNVHLFWGDERCVPPTHAESNYGMTYEVLLKKISIPAENVHRIQGERSPEEAARVYDEEITQHFHLTDDAMPRFDLTLLGLGEDGHTASLFPGTPVLKETRRRVADVVVPSRNTHRVSVTLPVLNNSREVLFLVSGESKAAILRDVLEGPAGRYPAQEVRPINGAVHWLVDDAAASLLTRDDVQTALRLP